MKETRLGFKYIKVSDFTELEGQQFSSLIYGRGISVKSIKTSPYLDVEVQYPIDTKYKYTEGFQNYGVAFIKAIHFGIEQILELRLNS